MTYSTDLSKTILAPLARDGVAGQRLESWVPHFDFGVEEIDALTEAVQSGSLDHPQSKGPLVAQFERELATLHGRESAIALIGGSAAIHTCVAALDPEPGDEIIVQPWTSPGNVIGILLQNCVPVFGDVDRTWNLDPDDVEAKITPRTRAITAIHLGGSPCDLDRLRDIARRHGLFIIEDCCQALFAEYQGQVVGTMGDIAAFSFNTKHITVGLGAGVIVNNPALKERAEAFVDQGLTQRQGGRVHSFLGMNYGINDLIGALLLTQLRKVPGYIEVAIENAERLKELIADIEEIVPQPVRGGDRHTYYFLGFTLDTDRLNCSAWEFAEAVNDEGIPLWGPYADSGRSGPLYRRRYLTRPDCYGRSLFPFDFGRAEAVDFSKVECPNGEALLGRSVYMHMWPNMTHVQLEEAAAAIRKAAARYRR